MIVFAVQTLREMEGGMAALVARICRNVGCFSSGQATRETPYRGNAASASMMGVTLGLSGVTFPECADVSLLYVSRNRKENLQ
jgi:hypothetical protein